MFKNVKRANTNENISKAYLGLNIAINNGEINNVDTAKDAYIVPKTRKANFWSIKLVSNVCIDLYKKKKNFIKKNIFPYFFFFSKSQKISFKFGKMYLQEIEI